MFEKIEKIIEIIEEWVLSISVIAMSVILVLGVIMRTLNRSLTFTEELGTLTLIVVSFFGIGYCVRKNRHISMTIIFDMVPEKIKKASMIINSVVSCIVMVILFVLSLRYIMAVYKMGNVSAALRIPMWIYYISVPIGFIIAAIEYLRTFITNIKNKQVYLSAEVELGRDVELEEIEAKIAKQEALEAAKKDKEEGAK
ncbi:TRAP transporter small permease [Tissierella sp. Yu-01]|uniref:TRAP transporter small permease n=1 Tax=Tissierella sp. Yu-01 TaxID=3035694 RepID=UPI00240CF850|nr:TRAP transporter small permease [Tissierella sp. Yu-01]WFA10001.1 TRAP transporter small permease [Tissierella sp. Yu-01]